MRLSGKVALVTGGGRGIGKEIALAFAREGADVMIDYIGNSAEAVEVQEAIRGLGRKSSTCLADVGKPEDCQKLVQSTVQTFGRLDLLVNNAGTEKAAPFWEVTEQDYDLVLAVNLKSAFFMSQAFVRALMAGGLSDKEEGESAKSIAGKIINISSVHEDVPFPHFAPYCLSKGGMRMLTRTLGVELGPLGITINSIAPGAIKTEINARLMADPAETAALIKNIPLGRMGETADVASLAVFLASRDADYMTGSTYIVDGGLCRSYHEQ